MTGKRFARLAAAVAVCLLVLAAFVVQLLGGRGSVPGWQQLRAALGVPLQTEESAPQTADGSTVVYVLDVGQGDAVLLCQDGAYCLIDTGPVEAEDALLYDLDVLGVPSLEYLVLTHPHADHTGNARAVLRTLPVKTLLLPLWQPTADETADWPRHLAELAADSGAENHGRPAEDAELGLFILSAEFDVSPAAQGEIEAHADEDNRYPEIQCAKIESQRVIKSLEEFFRALWGHNGRDADEQNNDNCRNEYFPFRPEIVILDRLGCL